MPKSKHIYYVNNVAFFRFSTKPDRQGAVTPPRAEISLPSRVPVFFESGEDVVGWASVTRSKNALLANLELQSKMDDTARAVGLIKMLYPCASFRITAIDGRSVLGADLVGIILALHGNADRLIKPLADNGTLRMSDKVLS